MPDKLMVHWSSVKKDMHLHGTDMHGLPSANRLQQPSDVSQKPKDTPLSTSLKKVRKYPCIEYLRFQC